MPGRGKRPTKTGGEAEAAQTRAGKQPPKKRQRKSPASMASQTASPSVKVTTNATVATNFVQDIVEQVMEKTSSMVATAVARAMANFASSASTSTPLVQNTDLAAVQITPEMSNLVSDNNYPEDTNEAHTNISNIPPTTSAALGCLQGGSLAKPSTSSDPTSSGDSVIHKLLSASLAPSTANSYKRVLNHFIHFHINKYPSQAIFPVPPQVLADYIAHLFSNNFSSATIYSYISAISFLHKLESMEEPTSTFFIKKLLKGVHNTKRQSDCRLPITLDILDKICYASVKINCISIRQRKRYDYVYSGTIQLCTSSDVRRQEWPKSAKKYLIDELFKWQLLRHQVHLMENLSQSKYALIFPNDTPVSSLDKLDDAVVFDVSKLVLNIEDIDDTQVLRRCLNTELEKTIFCKFMQDNEEKFRKKNKQRKLFSRKQMDELFPPGDSISIDKLDITAFCFIIFEGLNFMKPNGGLEKFPDDRDSTPGSDILRIKLCRNRLSHNPNDEISESDFKSLWEYMTTAFERLTEDVTYRQEGDRLRYVRPHMGIMDRLQAILEKWHEDDRAERSDHLETITEKIACSRDHTENVIRDSTKTIISAVKKYTKHKFHKARSRWHQVCIKDLEKFKELCERECLQYKVPEDSSTETDWSSSDSSQRSSRGDNTPRPGSNTSTYTDTYSDTRSFKDARAHTALREFDHHDGINRVQMDQQVVKPQLTEASQIRQRRGYVFNEQDEAQLSECEVQYAGTSIYTGTNTISSGYYTASGSSAYGNTERGENNSAFYFDDNEKEAPGTSDCGYSSSGYSAWLGKRETYPQHGHHSFVQSSEVQDINTYGFIPSSQNDSPALYMTVPEPHTDEIYSDIGSFHRTKSRNRIAHSMRNGLRHLLCLVCILSQEKEEDPQPIVNTRSRNLAVPRRNQQQNQQNESSQESPSAINNDYITLQLNDPYAVSSIA